MGSWSERVVVSALLPSMSESYLHAEASQGCSSYLLGPLRAVPANAEYMPDVSQSPNNVSIIVIGDATAPPSSSPNIVTTNPAGSRFMGTIRPWDGLITIRNKSTDTRFGTFVYTGYLVGGGMGYDEERGNWVGRWREGHAQFGSLTWEGTFCMRKRFA